jgi:hypothetical protein
MSATPLPALIQRFFIGRLQTQLGASRHSIAGTREAALGKDTHRRDGFTAALVMGHQQCQRGAAGHMQPLAVSADVDPSLVGMQEGRLGELLLDPILKGGQLFIGFFVEIVDAAGTQRQGELSGEVFFDPRVGGAVGSWTCRPSGSSLRMRIGP